MFAAWKVCFATLTHGLIFILLDTRQAVERHLWNYRRRKASRKSRQIHFIFFFRKKFFPWRTTIPTALQRQVRGLDRNFSSPIRRSPRRPKARHRRVNNTQMESAEQLTREGGEYGLSMLRTRGPPPGVTNRLRAPAAGVLFP